MFVANRKNLIYLAIAASVFPLLCLFTQTQVMGSFTATFANIAGLIGMVFMLWELILGNRFVARHLSRDYIALVKLHIFLGVYGFFFVMIHPFLEMLSYGRNLAFVFLPDFSTELAKHVTIGGLALYLYLCVWFSSAVWRGKIAYQTWRLVHHLSYLVLFFTFLHAVELGTFLHTFPLLMAYFYLLIAIFIALVIYRLSQLLDVGKFPYVLADKRTASGGVTSYFLHPLSVALRPRVGQFFFIKPSILGPSHPFTVMSFDDASGELVFGIKTVGKFTNQLESIQIGQTVFLDGPYGVFTSEAQNHEPKVIIAGGIGITPFVELIKRFGDDQTKLFYANKYLDDALAREQFQAQLGANYTDVISREDALAEPVIQGRINEQLLKDHLSPEFITKANFFICGSPSFMGGVLMALHQLQVDKRRIFTEEFSF